MKRVVSFVLSFALLLGLFPVSTASAAPLLRTKIDFSVQNVDIPQNATIENSGWEINRQKSDPYFINIFGSSGQYRLQIIENLGMYAVAGLEAGRNRLVVNFVVDDTGYYSIDFMSGFNTTNGGWTSFYIDGNYIGEYNFFALNGAPEDENLYGFRPMYLEAGREYELAMLPTKSGHKDYPNATCIQPRFFDFRGNDSLPTATDAVMDFSDKELLVGEAGVPEVIANYSDSSSAAIRKKLDGTVDADFTYTLASDNPDVVEISADGLSAIGKSIGTANITATATVGGVQLTTEAVEISVVPESFASVALTAPMSTIMSFDTDGVQVSVTGKMDNGDDADLSSASYVWTSSDETLATVSETGLVMPVSGASGEVTITAEVTLGEVMKSNTITFMISNTANEKFDFTKFINYDASVSSNINIQGSNWALNKSYTDRYFWNKKVGSSWRAQCFNWGLYFASQYIPDGLSESYADFAVIDINVGNEGNYSIDYTSANDRRDGGIYHIYVDGTFVGEYNFYQDPEIMPGDTQRLRPMHLTAGTHQVAFLLVARGNPPAISDIMNHYSLDLIGSETLPTVELAVDGVPESIFVGEDFEASVIRKYSDGAKVIFADNITYGANSKYKNHAFVTDTANSYTIISDTPAVLELAADGKTFTAKSTGTANIVVSGMVDGVPANKTIPVTVRVPELSELKVRSDSDYVLYSDTDGVQMSVTGTMTNNEAADLSSAEIIWSSLDTTKATVSEDGVVTGVSDGPVSIKATVTLEGITREAERELIVCETIAYPVQVYDFTTTPAPSLQEQTFEHADWMINTAMSDTYFWRNKVSGTWRSQYAGPYVYLASGTSEDRNVFTLDLKINKPGFYDVELQGSMRSDGGTANIYIDNKYVGQYSCYDSEYRENGRTIKLRSVPLFPAEEDGENVHTMSFVVVAGGDGKGNGASSSTAMMIRKLTLTGVPALPQTSFVGVETTRQSFAAGETEDFRLFVEQENGARYYAMPMLANAPSNGVGTRDINLSVRSLNEDIATVENGVIRAKAPGTAQLEVSGTVNGEAVGPNITEITINDKTYADAELDVVYEEFYVGGQTRIFAKAILNDGTVVPERDVDVRFEVPAEFDDIARIKFGNLLVTRDEGTATVKAYVTFNGITKEVSKQIKVKPVNIAGITAKIGTPIVSVLNNNGEQITATAYNNDGSAANLAGATYTYENLTPELIHVTDDGRIIAINRGYGRVIVTAHLGGLDFSYELEVVSSSGKSEPTLYTYEMRANAIENAKLYDWARNMQKNAIAKAEVFVENLDKIYDCIIPEGLPRAYQLGYHQDADEGTICPFCGVDIKGDYGQYGWIVNALTNPWKIQCPDCKTRFPSNDFSKFYELGLDEHGYFDLERAHAKNNENIANGGEDVLVNTTISLAKLREKFPNITEEEAKKWGVDDGFGWPTGNLVSGTEIPQVKSFIAFYLHTFWGFAGSGGLLNEAINALGNAYLYTGDKRFGRAGAILIDRMADVYPDYKLPEHSGPYIFFLGGGNNGKIQDYIWETDISQKLAIAYDTFYPMFDDPQVIAYASEKAKKYNLANPKLTGNMLRENGENRILREIYKGVKSYEIKGNYGMEQYSLSLAACALDTKGETQEMLAWLVKPHSYGKRYFEMFGVEYNSFISNSGGAMLTQFINDVDRDGFGWEVGTGYNQSWMSNPRLAINTINDYSAYKGTDEYDYLNLYKNPKYVKMFASNIFLTAGHGYTISFGDSGSVARSTNDTSIQSALDGFVKMGNPFYAQVYLYRHGTDLEDVNLGIFVKDPESIQDELRAVHEKYGELKLDSLNLTGFGVAMLRDGDLVKSSVVGGAKDLRRDIWMYYGRTNRGHAHRDQLNLGLDAYGFNFMPEDGYPVMFTSSDYQWNGRTLAHNTVSVNGADQDGVETGYPLHFEDAGKVKLMDIESPNSYYDVTDEYRRTVVTVEATDEVAYTVDFFRVKGGDEHVYSFHTQSVGVDKNGVDNGKVNVVDGLNLIAQKEGNNYVGSYAGADVPFGPDPSVLPNELGYVANYPKCYTWLKNVRKDTAVADGNFEINFEQTDFRRSVSDSKGLNLRYHAVNDWTPTQVSIATAESAKSPSNVVIPELDYLLIHNKGKDIDTLFTSVLEPYKGERYLESVEPATVAVKDGTENADDVVKAVKVKHVNDRVDYIIYATNPNVTYTVIDGENEVFDFAGFVGVHSINTAGDILSSFASDSSKIGDVEGLSRYTGKVADFSKGLAKVTNGLIEDSFITVSLNEELPTDPEEIEEFENDLADRYVYIANDKLHNGSYRIKSAKILGDKVELNIGDISLVRSWKDANAQTVNHNIEENQEITIPLSISSEPIPEFTPVADGRVSAGNVFRLTVNAKSPLGEKVTYSATVMPRDATLDGETGEIVWRAGAGQLGDNGFVITATDESGRTAMIKFIVEVLGGTGGGGGGSVAPDTPDDPDDPDDPDEPVTPDDPDAPEAGGFTDLGAHSWAEESINELAKAGIIKGTSATTYSPSANITRADFAILLVRAFELESDNEENFADVNASDYFARELAIARNTGIVGGIGDNKYAPRNAITRQDMMVIVYRALKKLGIELKAGEEPQAPDFAEVSDYAKEAVTQLMANGIVNGKNGLIDPKANTTRAEVAVLVARILALIEK